MGKKDNSYGHTNIDKYRRQLGKQEFKGRNKKHTLAEKNRAQSRMSYGSLLQTILLYSFVILAFLLGIYVLFYFMLEKPPQNMKHEDV